MNQNQKKIAEFAGCMLLAAAAFLLIQRWIPIVYSTNDDRMIAEIVSGQFTGKPESYGIQMTFGFTWFLSRLYELTGKLNWYGITLIAVQIFSLGTILYRVQSFAKSRKNKVLLLGAALGIFLAVWLKVYVQLTYTTTAAFAGMAAVFWYAVSKTGWRNTLMFFLLANLAFCIRPNIFYMFVPATGLVYLWKIFGKKDRKKLTIGTPFLVLAMTAVLFLINGAAYAKDGWKEFREFFEVRTDVYDYYDLLPYEEYPELYEPYGISLEEYQMLRVYDYTVLGDLPKEFFPNYLEACRELEQTQGITFVSKAGEAVKTFVKDFLTNQYGLKNTLPLAAALLLLIWLLWKKEYPLAVYLGIQSGVQCVIWLYFTYWGRAIERIQMTMSLIFLAVFLQVIYEIYLFNSCQEKQEERKSRKNLWQGAGLILLFLLAAGNLKTYRYDNIAKTAWYNDVQTIKEYCAEDPDRLYYMDIATMTELYGKCTIKNTEPDYINYISLGDWTAYCPHYEEKLKAHGIENVAETITDENTYVIMLHNYQLKCLKEYLNVEEEWVETIFGANETAYAVYQFHKPENVDQ